MIWPLPARKWKWRMRGAAYHYRELARQALGGGGAVADTAPDLVFASEYLDLATWKAIAPPPFSRPPAVVYFHENQATYPLIDQAPSDLSFAWTHLSSIAAAARVLFNSEFHRGEFLRATRRALRRAPDFVPEGLVNEVATKASVFPVGIDLAPHRRAVADATAPSTSAPIVVWNHRWEWDKNPEGALECLRRLRERGVPFRAILCGQVFARRPACYERAADLLGDRLLHLGYFAEREEYLAALLRASVVLSTARHEFFGIAVVEAMATGCIPVLPRALSYPEIVPRELHDDLLYDPEGTPDRTLERVLREPPSGAREQVRRAAARFDWQVLAPRLDRILEDAAATC